MLVPLGDGLEGVGGRHRLAPVMLSAFMDCAMNFGCSKECRRSAESMASTEAWVSRSNWSKFVDGQPQFDENGKIAKPSTYRKPDLTGCL